MPPDATTIFGYNEYEVKTINYIILKLGGSIITQKNRTGVFIRRKVIKQAASEIFEYLKDNPKTKIIIIHGAGSGGHQLAHKYGLKTGVGNNDTKRYGAMITRLAGQKLNYEIVSIFAACGLFTTTINTTSVVIQSDGTIDHMSFDAIDQTLKHNIIPVLYGDMAPDETLGMSICSGDNIANELAKHYKASKIIYATDVDGLYDSDPHTDKSAKIIKHINISELDDRKVIISGSHNIDVTGGLSNKILILMGSDMPISLKSVVICNGLKRGVIKKALMDQSVGSKISMN